MIDPQALLLERPSVFEGKLRGWLDGRPRRYSIDFISQNSDHVHVIDSVPHGRETTHAGSPAGMVSFAGLLERGAAHLMAAKSAHVRQCQDAAHLARALAAFAAARPAALMDRPDGEVGAAARASRAARPAVLTGVSEWAVDEVMVALGLSAPAASDLLVESVTLVEQLPATLAALETGTISRAHARMLIEVLGPMSDNAKRAEVEARLLDCAAGRTVAQLRVSARRAVLQVDAAAAARRLARAIRERQVRVFPGEDGMASWVASMTAPVALACHDALRQYAESCKVPGDGRTLDQRMVDCLADLILRPGETGLPPVQARLTAVASVDTLRGGDEPGEINGHPLPAAMVREVAYALGLLPRPHTASPPSPATPGPEPLMSRPAPAAPASAAPAAERTPVDRPHEAAGTPPLDADEAAGTPPLSTEDAVEGAALAELLGVRAIAGTALADLPRIAVVEEISGQLLALTTAAGLRAAATCSRRACRTGKRPCPHPPDGPCLGPPPATPGYRPSDPLDRFTRARDRRCRFPGCRAPATRCDLDHNQPWPAGATSADNLCCLCRHHHRLSHQAPGWRMRRLDDGAIEWTTPGGDRITTHPPRFGTDDPSPGSDPPRRAGPPLTLRGSVLGRPDPPRSPLDTAPF